MNIGLRQRFVLVALFFSLVPLSRAQYTVHDLGLGVAYAVNSTRTVVGSAPVGVNSQGFKWSNGGIQILGTLPGGTMSIAYDVNNFGVIAGSSDGGSFSVLHAFRFSGPMTDVGTLYGTTYGNAINDSGVIVGESQTGLLGYPSHAFAWSGGVMSDLGTLGGVNSAAAGINSRGDIVGWSDVTPSGTHAFIYTSGVMHDIGSLGGSSYAEDVNDSGVVVGWANIGNYYHAFRYAGGTMNDIGTLGGTYSLANAVNSGGDIVGNADTAGGATHAFLYHNGVMSDLFPYLSTIGLTGFSEALDINDNGDIVGEGVDATGHQHAFLLTIPEPSIAALLAVGLLCVRILGRGKRLPAESGN